MALPSSLFLVFIVVFCTSITNAVTDQSDVSALNAMYQNLNSPPQLTKWTSTGGDPCADNWKGVTCSASRVTQIKLPSLGLSLSGGIGYQLASLIFVTDFDISNNNLGNQIPFSLPPNLTSLNLAGCGYTGNLPYSISQMTSLKYLSRSSNTNTKDNTSRSSILACSNNKMDNNPLGPGLLISIRSKCSCCNCKPISPAHESDDDVKVYYVPLPVPPSASDKGLVKDKRGNELVKPLISNKSVRAVLEVALMAGVLLCVAVFARGVEFGPFKLTVLSLKKFK